jgi:uncharacterized protein with PQ loop repeat
MIEIIGWAGNIFFAICGLPQAIKTYKTKHIADLSGLFLWLWVSGELLTFVYVVLNDIENQTSHYPLYFNYTFNLTLAVYLVWAKYTYPKKYPID